ncbi:MAG: CoA-binding protein [Clostridia bacterium]|nr:CoA-binding protein [Clostridia bacterium]
MTLSEVMQQHSFVIVGDTLREEKYASIIKKAMQEAGYRVQCVGKELASLNEVEGEIDIVDLCIRPERGIELLRECRLPYKGVVIQPGAGSEEITAFLDSRDIPWLDGCLLVGLRDLPPSTM